MSNPSISPLPNNWVLVEIHRVAEVVTGNTPPTSKSSNYGGDIPFIKPPQLVDVPISKAPDTISNSGAGSARVLPAGAVLVSCIGSLGKTAITNVPCATNQQINALVFESSVRPEFGFYYAQTLEPWLRSVSSATTVSIVNKGKFETAPFPLAPLAEQIRIVEKLEELLSDLDAGVSELKAAQKKLAQYRQSLLKAAVEGALTAEWRTKNTVSESGAQLLARILTERRARWEAKQLAKFKEQGKAPSKGWQDKYPEPVQPDTADLPALPERWVWGSLEQLTEFITSGSRGWADYYSALGATFIRSQNINKDWLDLSDIAFVNPPPSSEGARTLVKINDLLLTITGANVGKAAQVNVDLQEAYVSQHVALIRLVDTILTEYIHLYLTAGTGGRGQLNKYAYGAGKPGLNLQQVGSVVVPIPGTQEIVALMQAVTAQLNAMQAQEVAITHSLTQSAAQRKNILKAAFSGQLVPQDPGDEPASVLLERIRAERAARPKQTKMRKAHIAKEFA